MNTQNPIDRLLSEVNKVVKGHPEMLELVAYAIVGDGHVLIEGNPGLAKTVTAKCFCSGIAGSTWNRIQMKPDIVPSDIVGLRAMNLATREFYIDKGPIFANIVLADEINRAAPRAQSALLEAMAEKSTTLHKETFRMEPMFCVIATMNPIEQEGTYPLPEAQLDRFMFKINVSYASRRAYEEMLENQTTLKSANPMKDIVQAVSVDDILEIRKLVYEVHVSKAARTYILDLVESTRPGEPMNKVFVQENGAEGKKFAEAILTGASPRAAQTIQVTAQVRAYHMGRDFVLPEDIQYVAGPTLRHRLLLQRKAKMDKKYTTDDAVKALLAGVPFHSTLEDYSK